MSVTVLPKSLFALYLKFHIISAVLWYLPFSFHTVANSLFFILFGREWHLTFPQFCWVIIGTVKVAQSCLTLCDPMVYTVHGILQARILEWVPFPSPGDLPNTRIKPRSPTLQADSLPAEPQGKPKNTGVGSLFLLQGIFLIQELNQSLLPCRRILYQLSYQGSPIIDIQHHINLRCTA